MIGDVADRVDSFPRWTCGYNYLATGKAAGFEQVCSQLGDVFRFRHATGADITASLLTFGRPEEMDASGA